MTTVNGAPLVVSDEQALADAFHSTEPVAGLTHCFYRYPARFSPEFVRLMISELSEPGDIVLDPFMGGGTTIVEAVAAGRRAIGIDINGLSHFVTRVKTTPLSERDASELAEWGRGLESGEMALPEVADQRTKNLPDEVRHFLRAALQSLRGLRFPRQRRFARCVLLRVGQWALDNKQHPPKPDEMSAKVQEEIQDMLAGLREFAQATQYAGVAKNKITGRRVLIQGSVAEAATWGAIAYDGRKPKLVLTSPPYPGVHVLYHRWQVSGRRESPAPYWLADLRDGHGASYYTMGSRSTLGLRNYFTTLRRGFENLKNVLSPDTMVVQLLAFSDTRTQLPLYMDTLAVAGYQEVQVPSLASGKHIRTVPRRKWYTSRQDGEAGQEVLIVHRPCP